MPSTRAREARWRGQVVEIPSWLASHGLSCSTWNIASPSRRGRGPGRLGSAAVRSVSRIHRKLDRRTGARSGSPGWHTALQGASVIGGIALRPRRGEVAATPNDAALGSSHCCDRTAVFHVEHAASDAAAPRSRRRAACGELWTTSRWNGPCGALTNAARRQDSADFRGFSAGRRPGFRMAFAFFRPMGLSTACGSLWRTARAHDRARHGSADFASRARGARLGFSHPGRRAASRRRRGCST